MKKVLSIVYLFILSITSLTGFAQNYPDQQYIISGIDAITESIESSSGIENDEANNSIQLENGSLSGYFILKPMGFDDFFNRGLPSWNGFAPEYQSSSFKIEMRFEMAAGWSRWVTAGYWDNNIFAPYGYTSFTGGEVDIDYVKLDSYIKKYQFKVSFKRNSLSYEAPRINQLSFFVSDSRSDVADINSIVNETPPELLVSTDFVYQYSVDSEIGGSICSPSTVSMILKSYDIAVDTYDFAVRTKDPYWGIYGVWPRIVQHAAEYGLQGTVTRYRTWNDAYEVLNNGGRIAITVGPPLYSGHLIMLAGFDANGNPRVHDPAKNSGYNYLHNKRSLTESWFNKGGISYTFYPKEEVTSINNNLEISVENVSVFPNPFTEEAEVLVDLAKAQKVTLKIYNLQGQCVQLIKEKVLLEEGKHKIPLNNSIELSNGIYILNMQTEKGFVNTKFIKR